MREPPERFNRPLYGCSSRFRVVGESGKCRVLEEKSFVGQGREVSGGAATVLDVKLDPAKELESFTVRAIANQVLVGLMGATLGW